MTTESRLDLDAIERASETCGIAVMLANLLRVTDYCRRLRGELALVGDVITSLYAQGGAAIARAEAAEAKVAELRHISSLYWDTPRPPTDSGDTWPSAWATLCAIADALAIDSTQGETK